MSVRIHSQAAGRTARKVSGTSADGSDMGASTARRRVLMISQAFPPTGGVGVHRAAKFAKYLSHYGWRPVVWSATRLMQLPYDEGLLADLPDDLIHYRSRPLSYVTGHRQIMELLGKVSSGKWWQTRVLPGLEWRLLRCFYRSAARLIPDDHILWALKSLIPLLRIVRKERIEVLYSTYSPISCHLLAGWLKRLTGVPWVADFRDLFVDDYCYPQQGRFRRWADGCLQQSVLERADAVLAVGQGQTDVLASHVPTQRHKFLTITNGVDTEDFDRVDRSAVRGRLHGDEDRFVLTFTGQFTSRRTSDALFEGLSRFARLISGQAGKFEVRIVGVISREMRDRFHREGIPLAATGFLPHARAIEQMVSADVLLLLAPVGHNADTLVTGKVFEYLASGRPVLAVGPAGGVVHGLIESCNAGIHVTQSCEEVVAALEGLWKEWRAGRLRSGCTMDRLEPYTRKNLTGQLAAVLERVCEASPAFHKTEPRALARADLRLG